MFKLKYKFYYKKNQFDRNTNLHKCIRSDLPNQGIIMSKKIYLAFAPRLDRQCEHAML